MASPPGEQELEVRAEKQMEGFRDQRSGCVHTTAQTQLTKSE